MRRHWHCVGGRVCILPSEAHADQAQGGLNGAGAAPWSLPCRQGAKWPDRKALLLQWVHSGPAAQLLAGIVLCKAALLASMWLLHVPERVIPSLQRHNGCTCQMHAISAVLFAA